MNEKALVLIGNYAERKYDIIGVFIARHEANLKCIVIVTLNDVVQACLKITTSGEQKAINLFTSSTGKGRKHQNTWIRKVLTRHEFLCHEIHSVLQKQGHENMKAGHNTPV